MKIFLILVVALVLAACKSDGTNSATSDCAFSKTLLQHDSTLDARFPPDTASTAYTFRTYNVDFDSLLHSLCTEGLHIAEAWISAPNSYLCKDLIGPRPVVVLTSPDTTILHYGFSRGNYGRLGCSTSLYYYKPE